MGFKLVKWSWMLLVAQLNFARFFGVVLILLFFCSGCSSRARVSPGFEKQQLHKIALAPPLVNVDIQREKVTALQEFLVSELKNRGFAVLDSDLLKTYCDPECDLPRLRGERGLDGVLRLEIKTAARNNFLAGYYTALSGRLVLLTDDLKDKYAVAHTQTMTGGLIFSSGQVLEGLDNQLSYSKDESFKAVSRKFIATLVAALPAPSASRPSESPAIRAQTLQPDFPLEIKKISPEQLQICVAVPNSFEAWIVLGRVRANLRPARAGAYCGNFAKDLFYQMTEIAPRVEIVSPFGEAVDRSINLAEAI